MRDLTQGSIARHLVGMAVFIAMGLAFQAAYSLIDLYFVARLGQQAVAGVGAAMNLTMLVMAGSQLIGVGAVALIAQAVGRRDGADANLVFNQAVGIALAASLATLALGYTLGAGLLGGLAADARTAAFARIYLAWFLPALACMYPTMAVGSALRATGVVRPSMILQSASVLLNAILAPILIAGWGTGHPLGVAGAGLATTIATTLALAGLVVLLPRVQRLVRLNRNVVRPAFAVWRRLIVVGLPAAGEMFMMFVIMGVLYRVIRVFGPDAQAGFAIGSRVMQAIFLPAMAVAFAAAPVAGQNFGAREFVRVRATFRHSAIIGASIMLVLTGLCQIRPELLVAPFTHDPAVIAQAVGYLHIASWNFVGSGLVFACSGMFQGLGDTTPSFISSASRLLTFVVPAFWLAGLPGARLTWIWHLSVASVALQAVTSLVLLHGVFRRRLGPASVLAPAVDSPPVAADASV